jgi:hypothetical protein
MGSQHFDKTLREPCGCQSVGARNMAVERGRVKLGENVYPLDLRVDAVTDGDIDQAILGAERNSRLGAEFG